MKYEKSKSYITSTDARDEGEQQDPPTHLCGVARALDGLPVGHQHKKGKATQANQHTKQSMFVFTNIL